MTGTALDKTWLEPDECPSEPYLGSSDSLLARTADAVLILDTATLPVHSVYLCHGVLAEALTLALEDKQARGSHSLLQVPVPECSTDDLVLLLRLLYSQRPEEVAKIMTFEQLQSVGLVADKLGYQTMLAVVEMGLLSVCRVLTPAVWEATPHAFQECLTQDTVFVLLDWAERVGSEQVAKLCGTFLGMHSVTMTGSTKHLAFAAAMGAYHSRVRDCRVELPF